MNGGQKDSKPFQMERIRRTVNELAPNAEVQFDPEAGSMIRYRIDDKSSGTVLGLSGHDLPSVIADSSDAYLREYIKSLGAGKI
jgi:hypothetical protein